MHHVINLILVFFAYPFCDEGVHICRVWIPALGL